MICFYHSADLDGHCSGAIVKHAFPDCQMVGIDYGQPFPWQVLDEGNHEEVWMVDFSLQPFSDMVKLDRMCRLKWIDHHKTAIDEYGAPPFEDGPPLRGECVLDTNFAACELTWNHIAMFSILSGLDVSHMTGKTMPEAVHLLGRYDIWKHAEVKGALEFQYGMRAFADTSPSSEIGMDCWRHIFDGKWTDKIINDGVTLLQYERNQNAKFLSVYGFDVEFDGLRCIAANRGMSNSLLFESKWNHDDYDAMCMFAWKGGQWTVSLYTDKPGIDVSTICKARGGGGHKGASGFQCDTLPFLRRE